MNIDQADKHDHGFNEAFTMTKTYFVSWFRSIGAESKSEASVKALALMNDPDEWQFNASVEETEDGNQFTSDEQKYCNDMCGNLTPCDKGCEDYKNRFKKD